MSLVASDPTAHQAYRYGALALLLAAAAILVALGFQHIGGYAPCELCLEQRYAYYAGVPLLFGALVALSTGYVRVAAALFALVALAFLGNAALGVYHAGAEWKFWPGPSACTGVEPLNPDAGSLLERLKTASVVRCDEPALRIAGLSFAGWNVIASLLIALFALRAAGEAPHAR
jgi:disulfide bond formation protein DsbB